jgi:hypothetical protein
MLLTLQATALVNEAYLRLVDEEHRHVESRSQFFAVAAQAMRRNPHRPRAAEALGEAGRRGGPCAFPGIS